MSSRIPGLSFAPFELMEQDDHFEAETFHQASKVTRRNRVVLQRQTDRIMRDPSAALLMARAFKRYPGAPRVELPVASLGPMTLTEAVRRRRSQVGPFTGESIALDDLAAVLRFACGAVFSVEARARPGEHVWFRTVPSAGALYPIEAYAIATRVDGLPEGIYHYDVRAHAFARVRGGPIRAELLAATPYKELCGSSAVVLALTGVLARSVAKYLFRGYRFASYDAGAVLTNLYLAATARGLGTCAVGGFFDDSVAQLLALDDTEEQPLVMFAIGRSRDGD
jgi:SagB-type dehydrogenase family enzyme